MKAAHEKGLAVFACLLGVSGIAYGMTRENDGVFLLGIGLVAGAYLFIRRKLKG